MAVEILVHGDISNLTYKISYATGSLIGAATYLAIKLDEIVDKIH